MKKTMVDKSNFSARADDLYAQAEKKLKGNYGYNNIISQADSLRT